MISQNGKSTRRVKMRRKITLTLICYIIVAVFLSGCIIPVKETITFYEDGTADIEITVSGEEKDDDLDEILKFYTWELLYMFPELRGNYALTYKEMTDNGKEYINYIFKSKKRLRMKNTDVMSFTRRLDGSFVFSSTIAKLWDEAEDGDEVAFELTVKMPGDIVTTNATTVNGNTAKWVITQEQLTKELRLSVVTASGSQPGFPPRMVLFIVAGVVVLILAGGILIILRIRRRTS